MRPAAFLTLTDPAGTRWVARAERRPAASYGKEFCTVFVEDFAQLARLISKPLTLRVLMQLPMALRTHPTWLPLNQTALAHALGTRQPEISGALKELVAMGAVLRERQNGVLVYQLPETWMWRGTAGQYRKARRENPDRVLRTGPDWSPETDPRQMDIAALLPPPEAGPIPPIHARPGHQPVDALTGHSPLNPRRHRSRAEEHEATVGNGSDNRYLRFSS